jgi:hypothetical protein
LLLSQGLWEVGDGWLGGLGLGELLLLNWNLGHTDALCLVQSCEVSAIVDLLELRALLTSTPVDIVREHFVSWIGRLDISLTIRMERGLSKICGEGRISQPPGGRVEVTRFLLESFLLCRKRPLLFLGFGFVIFLRINHDSSLFAMACHFIQRRHWVLLRLPLVRNSPISGSWLHAFDILVVFWRLKLAAVSVNVALVQSLRVVGLLCLFCRHAIWVVILILHLDSFVNLFTVLLFWLR